ncbi:MAG: TM2 domain-containing protein [Bacteroidales bacterium]|nr:TM2 domain-containing protein [Candidatus Scybalousia scybalohippi]MCQ2326353.1 TM2 domain-containing protein [Bacteroidales bacterium]
MESNKIDLFLAQNGKMFTPMQLVEIRSKLQNIPDEKASIIMGMEFKDPTLLLIISVLIGELGVDRFMLGNVGMGVLKLLTGGLCGILWIIDIINIQKMTKEYNYRTLNELLMIM